MHISRQTVAAYKLNATLRINDEGSRRLPASLIAGSPAIYPQEVRN
jgi:hypothetical protein